MTTAEAKARNVPISTKDTIELSKMLRGKTITKAKALLERVLAMEQAVPYRRYTNGIGHKPGTGAGRYPLKAAKAMLKVINSAEANAGVKGMNTGKLIIAQLVPNQGTVSYHYGRKRGITTKSTHIDVIVKEKE